MPAEKYDNWGLSVLSRLIAEAVSQGVDPLHSMRTAASAAAASQTPKPTETKRDIVPQMLAVTRMYFGDRLGLVALTKRRHLQSPEPKTARPEIFGLTEPAVFHHSANEEQAHL